jgi:hypothetical protein
MYIRTNLTTLTTQHFLHSNHTQTTNSYSYRNNILTLAYNISKHKDKSV